MDSKLIAQQKFDKALKLIEQAQALLCDACVELSPLAHGFEQWELTGKHYDLIHQLWRDVAYSGARDVVDLDPGTKERLSATV